MTASETHRLRRLEDRQEIADLVVRYGFLVDDHDLDGVVGLFAPDATLRTHAGMVKGDGREGVADYFRQRFEVLGPTNHFVHGHVVDFSDDDHATGTVSSHAEVWRDGAPMLTAMRYLDTYVRENGHWLFADRVQSYLYFADVREYPEVLGAKDRVRLSATQRQPGDWPAWYA